LANGRLLGDIIVAGGEALCLAERGTFSHFSVSWRDNSRRDALGVMDRAAALSV